MQLKPDCSPAYYYLGLSRQRLGYTQSSLEAYGKAIAIDPNNPQFYYHRGLALEELSELPAARKDFQIAAKKFKQQGNFRRYHAIANKLRDPQKSYRQQQSIKWSKTITMTIDPQQLIELALTSGAVAAEVYQSSSLSHPVFFEANRLKQLESSESVGTALRLWREGCPGLAVGYGDVEPEILVETALNLSYLNAPEEIEFSAPRQAIYDPIGQDVAVECLIEMGNQMIGQIRQVYPEVICSGEWECEREITRLVNSQGLYCQYTDTALSYYLGIEWVRGEMGEISTKTPKPQNPKTLKPNP